MPKFTTRVELHAATKDDYEKLHAEMEKEGFARFAILHGMSKVKFPPAEYNFEGPHTIKKVIELAQNAAGRVVPKFSILTTEVANRDGFNLEISPSPVLIRVKH